MQFKSKWDGMKIELIGNTQGPLHFRKKFEGTDEATKVLVHTEETVVEYIILDIGGFSYEVQMSMEESIQQIKNITELCKVVRAEVKNFIQFTEEMTTTAKPVETEPVTEETPVVDVPTSLIQTILAKVKAELSKDK